MIRSVTNIVRPATVEQTVLFDVYTTQHEQLKDRCGCEYNNLSLYHSSRGLEGGGRLHVYMGREGPHWGLGCKEYPLRERQYILGKFLKYLFAKW